MSQLDAVTDDDQGDVRAAGAHSSLPPAVRSERARLAVTTRHHGKDSERARAAQRDYRAVALAEYIRKVVDAAPPLTAEQRDKLAVLLRASSPARPSEVA